jgi:hypothetical protein
MIFSVSQSPDNTSGFIEVGVKTLAELGEVALKNTISTSTFKHGYRNKENFIKADFIGLDIDNDGKKGTPVLSLLDAKKIFQPFKHIILTSKSHGTEKNGIVGDRFRVILVLDYPITQAKDFYSTWFWLKEQFPAIDNQCKDPSRFWYAHKDVVSVNETGATILPVRYSEPEKPVKDGKSVLPGERGELSKHTLNFLEFGVEAGNRNGTVYKVARDFQQSLYEFEEAESRILSALDRNGVITSDFSEDEAKLAIGSAYSKDAKHAPRISEGKRRAFSYVELGILLETPDKEEDWLVKGLLLRGGLSIIVGAPKIGKTTLIRQLEKSILRGEPFLERKTFKGSIMHFSFDEKAKTSKRHYQALGLTKNDKMILHFGALDIPNYIKDLEDDILKYKPSLVVVDTLFDMVEVDDVNNYGPIKKALSVFSSLAERTDAHVLFVHHTNKPNPNFGRGSGHSILGSTAIFGSVDCCMIFEQKLQSPTIRLLSVKGRAVDDIGTLNLDFDKQKQTYFITSIDENASFF